MAKIDVNDYLTPKIDEPDRIEKEVKVQYTGRQFILPLPSLFVEALNISTGDSFIIKASFIDKKDYSIKFKKNAKRKKVRPNR